MERDEAGEFSQPLSAEVPIDWPARHFLSQVLAAEHTGSWLWAVELTLAEYLALRHIEAWADRTLARLDRL